jgi:hypothetical protein
VAASNKSWGDEEFEEETKDYETPVDENGIKYSYQFKTNEDGKDSCHQKNQSFKKC